MQYTVHYRNSKQRLYCELQDGPCVRIAHGTTLGLPNSRHRGLSTAERDTDCDPDAHGCSSRDTVMDGWSPYAEVVDRMAYCDIFLDLLPNTTGRGRRCDLPLCVTAVMTRANSGTIHAAEDEHGIWTWLVDISSPSKLYASEMCFDCLDQPWETKSLFGCTHEGGVIPVHSARCRILLDQGRT